MTVISQALSLAKVHVERLPVSMGGWFGEGLGLQTEASTLAHLNTMGGVGWLFAVVDRISTLKQQLRIQAKLWSTSRRQVWKFQPYHCLTSSQMQQA